MKKAVAGILTAAMTMSLLAGCGSGDSNSGTKDTQAPAGTTGESTAAGDTAGAPESDGGSAVAEGQKDYIDYDEDPYEVVIEVLTLGSNMESLPAMEEAINEITVPAINCTVKFQAIHIADHATKTALWAAGGEKVDIYYVGTTVPFTQFVSDGMIIPITELLDERGATVKEKSGALLDAFTVDGEIYAVPQDLYCAAARGINYNADLLKEIGMEVPETWDMDTLTEIGYKLKEANPEYTLIAKNGSTDAGEILYFYGMDGFGSSSAVYGVLLNPETDTTVSNLFKSDEFKEYCKYNIEWKENGFMPADQAVNGQNAQDVYKSGTSFCNWVAARPSEEISVQNNTKFDSQQALFSNPWLTSSIVQEKAWGISTTCERPEKAMDFINLMYENTELANILNYGIEGTDYVYTDGSDKIVTYPEGIDGSTVGWNRAFNMFGDQMEIAQMAPATEDYYTELKEFNDCAVACATLGYSFDATNVATQVSSVSNVVQEYVPSLVYGEIPEAELDAYLEEMNAKLDEAGINEIIEENQAQLDAWAASK